MRPPRSIRRSRRVFLQSIPTIVAGTSVVAATEVRAEPQQAPVGADPITADALECAQQIIGVNLPAAERDSARPLVARNRDHYDAVRAVVVPSETEPAFSFRVPVPARPRAHRPSGTTRTPRPAAKGTARRPAALGDLAFEPVTVLADLVASRQISSTELTKMYLDRLKRHDATLHCVITLTEELALSQAANADREIQAGHVSRSAPRYSVRHQGSVRRQERADDVGRQAVCGAGVPLRCNSGHADA